jgi:hypothetical protein
MSVSALEKLLDPRFLSMQEREMIRDLKAAGSSIRAVARYLPHGANRKAAAQRAWARTAKLAAEPDLRDYVKDKLLILVSGADNHTLVEEFPDKPETRVSPSEHRRAFACSHPQTRSQRHRQLLPRHRNMGIPAGKGHAGRLIPLHPDAAAALQ